METNKLRTLAHQASKSAYSPYSKALVGCALETDQSTLVVILKTQVMVERSVPSV